MVDNIEKVLERGEKIELLVDKTDNLRFQVCIACQSGVITIFVLVHAKPGRMLRSKSFQLIIAHRKSSTERRRRSTDWIRNPSMHAMFVAMRICLSQ